MSRAAGMRLEVDFRELDDFIHDINRAGGKGDDLMNAVLTNSATEVQSNQRSRAAHRTGTLQNSIAFYIQYAKEAVIEVSEKYGIWLEYGTGIYGKYKREIRPRVARVLAFKVGGKQVYARSVKGMPPKPFFWPGWLASQSYIKSQLEWAGEKAIVFLQGKVV